MANEPGSDWIEHDGGKCPIIGSVGVELKFRDGLTSDGHAYPADIIGWVHINCADDIIAYRVVKSCPPPFTPSINSM
jgi:hypothetical protein